MDRARESFRLKGGNGSLELDLQWVRGVGWEGKTTLALWLQPHIKRAEPAEAMLKALRTLSASLKKLIKKVDARITALEAS